MKLNFTEYNKIICIKKNIFFITHFVLGGSNKNFKNLIFLLLIYLFF